jgi:hypothetical protein
MKPVAPQTLAASAMAQDGQAVVAGGAVGFVQVGAHGAGGGQLLQQVRGVSAASIA